MCRGVVAANNIAFLHRMIMSFISEINYYSLYSLQIYIPLSLTCIYLRKTAQGSRLRK
jgi:hypothetical protein